MSENRVVAFDGKGQSMILSPKFYERARVG